MIHVQKELDLGENPFDPGSIMAARSSSGGVLPGRTAAPKPVASCSANGLHRRRSWSTAPGGRNGSRRATEKQRATRGRGGTALDLARARLVCGSDGDGDGACTMCAASSGSRTRREVAACALR